MTIKKITEAINSQKAYVEMVKADFEKACESGDVKKAKKQLEKYYLKSDAVLNKLEDLRMRMVR